MQLIPKLRMGAGRALAIRADEPELSCADPRASQKRSSVPSYVRSSCRLGAAASHGTAVG